MRLDRVEARVVGSLAEKQLTTPQQYPLSLNALTLACNQASNRNPVVSFTEREVQAALDSLKQKGIVRFVLPSHGRSVVRYRHLLDEKLALDERQLALVAVLLLRGPQTVGEMRLRTERMASFDSTIEVESDLEGLARGEEPFVARLPRRPGQKEERWTQLLAETGAAAEAPDAAVPPGATAGPAGPTADPAGATADPELRAEVAGLTLEVAGLRSEVGRLRQDLEGLRRELGA